MYAIPTVFRILHTVTTSIGFLIFSKEVQEEFKRILGWKPKTGITRIVMPIQKKTYYESDFNVLHVNEAIVRNKLIS